jgi:hypothetical protein
MAKRLKPNPYAPNNVSRPSPYGAVIMMKRWGGAIWAHYNIYFLGGGQATMKKKHKEGRDLDRVNLQLRQRAPTVTGDKKMKRTIMLALLASTSAHAAEITVNKNTTPPSVTFRGAIQFGDEWKFINVVRDVGKVTVRLNSQGGKIDPAMKIGFEVRSWQMTTEVVGTCQSACALIWAAGVDRRLPLETSLGFHQPANEDGTASVEGIRRIEEYLRFLGYGEDTVRFAVHMPPKSMAWVMSVTQAEEVGLVVDPVKHAPPATTPKCGSKDTAVFATTAAAKCAFAN